MLSRVRSRSARAGLETRVKTHLCGPQKIGLETPIDFALAFWMVHEVPDQAALFRELHSLLKGASALLIVDPRLHISAAAMRQTERAAESAGFRLSDRHRITFSRTALCTEPEHSAPFRW